MLSDLNFDLIGRKIPHHLENPLDNILIKGCEYSAPFLKKLKMTPNIRGKLKSNPSQISNVYLLSKLI